MGPQTRQAIAAADLHRPISLETRSQRLVVGRMQFMQTQLILGPHELACDQGMNRKQIWIFDELVSFDEDNY